MVTRVALILLSFGMFAAGQRKPAANSATPKAGPKKGAAAVPDKPPSATIHTTVGDMKCELFPDKAPKAVANFIGLARGTKPWKDPATGNTIHGKPLYDGVIFHRVIPEFMVQ